MQGQTRQQEIAVSLLVIAAFNLEFAPDKTVPAQIEIVLVRFKIDPAEFKIDPVQIKTVPAEFKTVPAEFKTVLTRFNLQFLKVQAAPPEFKIVRA